MPEEEKDKRVKIKVEEDSETLASEVEQKSEVEPEKTPEQDKPEETKPEKTEEEKKEEEVKPTETTEGKPESDKIPAWIIILAFFGGLALGAGLIGGIFYYRSSVSKTLSEVTPTPEEQTIPTEAETSSASPSASPKASPGAKNDFSKYSLQILNGSGISGEAGRVDALLEKAGFTKTTTGNAKAYDYEETEVAIKASLPDTVYEAISSALSTYELKKADPLSSSSSYDVVITVGKSKK
jgi:hypothetical protein